MSLSARTIVYKGMLLTTQLDQYFPDLHNPLMETALALVHSRFSTNTFPSWDRAHPYRYIAHNGEINTVRGNANWMHAREARFEAEAFGDDIRKIRPIINPNGSDSGMFDNTLELLYLSGRSLPHAVMMMIPEPWSNHESMDDDKRAFYQYHSSLMEPWDGPASISFTDGTQIGAVLDRNGLRPGRYYVTKDDLVILASEAGVLDVPPENVVRKGRLQPGKMFLVDTAQGRIVEDEEIKRTLATARPYREWLDEYLIHVDDLPKPPEVPQPDHDTLLQRQVAFGYTFEDQRIVLTPMARDGVEADRLDGQRHAAGGAFGQAAPALRLLQAAVRAGHQPADRLHPRGDHHLGRDAPRLRRQPAQSAAVGLPPPRAEVADHHQRGVRARPPHGPAGAARRRAADPVPREPRREGPGQVDGRAAPDGAAPDRGGRGQRHHPERPRRQQGLRADPGADGGRRPAPLPDPRRPAHPREPRARDRRGARGASLLAADRLRRQRDQSVPRLRDDRPHDPRRPADRHRPQDGLQELRQGRGEGRDQGHLEDGHLVAAELSRRAGVRGARPAPGRHRRVLQLDGVARRRHRHRRDRAGSAHAAQRRVPGPPRGGTPHAARRRPVPVARRGRVPPVQSGEHPPPAEGGAHRQLRDVQGVLGADQRPGDQALHAARPARLQGRRADSASRRWSRSRAS